MTKCLIKFGQFFAASKVAHFYSETGHQKIQTIPTRVGVHYQGNVLVSCMLG